ncbi:helix-turn-helix domain-containing protein [Tractidigestivibacter sp.]|uniref:helix-turn-helix domain-containing protein n=1 Tax=Tractidigestivibacter sp. TaxID=2847320 RepID=UPI0039C442C1
MSKQQIEVAPATKELLTIKEAAALLDISTTTVYHMAQTHEIPTSKIRGQWRIPQRRLRSRFGIEL